MTVKNFRATIQIFLLFASVNLIAQDGILDTSFGINGVVKTDINNLYDVFTAFTVQDDGKIIVVGNNASGSTANKESIIVRYNENGSLDTSFGTNGIIVAAFSTAYDTLNAVEVQNDGKIVVGGYDGLDFILARYTTSGQLDPSFGTNGIVRTNYYTSVLGGSQDRINCIAIQDNGKILAGGYSQYYGSYFYAIVRYNTNGTLDNSFGVNGKVDYTFNPSGAKEIFDMIVTPTGKIYAVGEAITSSSTSFTSQAIVRINSNGSIDSGFGTNGVRTFSFTNVDGRFKDIKLQDDGKLVIVGNRSVQFTLVRLSENGALDTTFSDDGRITPSLSILGAAASFARSVLIQSDGKIIISGNTTGTAGDQSVVIRYLPNGDLDTTFSDDGLFSFLVGDEYQGGSFSVFQPNGMLVVGGEYNDTSIANTDLYLFRITASTLSTSEFSGSNVIVYPNPVNDKLYIHANAGDRATFQLFSIDGKEVKTDPVLNLSDDLIQIDVSDLAKGVYLLRCEENNTRIIKKIIIER